MFSPFIDSVFSVCLSVFFCFPLPHKSPFYFQFQNRFSDSSCEQPRKVSVLGLFFSIEDRVPGDGDRFQQVSSHGALLKRIPLQRPLSEVQNDPQKVSVNN